VKNSKPLPPNMPRRPNGKSGNDATRNKPGSTYRWYCILCAARSSAGVGKKGWIGVPLPVHLRVAHK